MIEFAVVAPVLALAAVGIVDYGIGLYTQFQVRIAAQAGSAYAAGSGLDQTGIASAMRSATSLSSLDTSTASTQTCGCPGTTGITTATCGTTCASGLSGSKYLTVTAKASYATLIKYPGVPQNYQFTSVSLVRIP